MTQAEDTIVAIATPPGRGAIGVVRLTGPEAHALARLCIRRWPSQARIARLALVRDPRSGARVDRVVVTRYDAPDSYTGEDLVEISGHGGLLSPASVAAALIRAGARQAEPGEFTRRAVLNGKLDLVQAEAIGSLVDAPTEAARRNALHHMDGGLSRRIGMVRSALLELEALIAYEIDFPEEDDGPIPASRIEAAAAAAQEQVNELLATIPIGEMVRNGATVVLAGRPNVGKSSLFNALLGVERAIVHAAPGTTRDAIEAVVEAGRWPLRLVDTAGLRASEDEVERSGVAISRRYIANAQVVLACGTTDEEVAAAMEAALAAGGSPATLAVLTKADLSPGEGSASPGLRVSALRREGLGELLAAIDAAIDSGCGSWDPSLPLLTRARHQAALDTASRELAAFRASRRAGEVPAAVAAVHIRAAVAALEGLIGTVGVEEVLDRVFATFCVGK